MSKSSGGIYQYTAGLVKTLAEVDSNKVNIYFLVSKNSDLLKEINFDQDSLIHPEEYKLSIKYKIKNLIERAGSLYYKRLIKRHYHPYFYTVLDVIINNFNIDIIHYPFQKLIKRKYVRTISTMHDVQELHFPEFFTSQERRQRAINYKRVIDEADHIVVSYEHIRKDISRYFAKPKTKVSTILLKMDNLWFKEINQIRDDNLPFEKYILYPAATWAHKNHLKLLEALQLLKEQDNISINLVCTGHKKDLYYESIQPFIKCNALQDHIKFLGVVENETLFTLYQKCLGVVVPTLYEAGSFPLMESILMNIPVVCSNVTSLPETVDNQEFIFDPTNVESIALKVKELWLSEDFRERSKANSERVQERLTNTNALEKFCRLYDSLINSNE